jgi:hypothetical protein
MPQRPHARARVASLRDNPVKPGPKLSVKALIEEGRE